MSDKQTYVHLFTIITDCPFLTAEHVEYGLKDTSLGYKHRVIEDDIFMKGDCL